MISQTISAIVRDPPRSVEALAKIPGVGQVKADKYGETFVRARPVQPAPNPHACLGLCEPLLLAA